MERPAQRKLVQYLVVPGCLAAIAIAATAMRPLVEAPYAQVHAALYFGELVAAIYVLYGRAPGATGFKVWRQRRGGGCGVAVRCGGCSAGGGAAV